MNLRELIRNSDQLLELLEIQSSIISIKTLCDILNIDFSKLYELFEDENIVIDKSEYADISIDILRQLLLKEPEISVDNDKIIGFAFASNKFQESISNIKSTESIAIKLCKKLGISLRMLSELLANEGYIVGKLKPVTKININELKKLIKPTPKNQEEKLEVLTEKISKSAEKEYTRSVVLNQYIRSEYIRSYAKIRANGIYELCDHPAPFKDIFDNPFLETHHIIYLSKGGNDSIENVAALCPNCHRRLHNLNLQSDIEKLLSLREKA